MFYNFKVMKLSGYEIMFNNLKFVSYVLINNMVEIATMQASERFQIRILWKKRRVVSGLEKCPN